MSEADVARQLISLESGAVRRMRATAKLTVKAVAGSGDTGVVASSLAVQMSAVVLTVKTATRMAAAKQFADSTKTPAVYSGADDLSSALRAGAVYAHAWQTAYNGAGGASGGGGSVDDWNDARIEVHRKIDRIAAWEVMHAWNDEHRRNADALPNFRFIERWCAILDTHLCKRCRSMNGKRADASGTFREGWPPLHGDCRCFIVTELA